MKSLLLVCCIFLIAEVALGNDRDDIVKIVKEHIDQCAEEKQMSSVDIDTLFRTDLEGEERTKYGCLHACISGRLNLMKDGRVNVEAFPSTLEEVLAEHKEKIAEKLEGMKKCAEKVKELTDECDIGYEFSRCLTLNNTD